MTPLDLSLPGLSEPHRCSGCRFLWSREQDGKLIDQCLRWRRITHERCGEYEVGRRMHDGAGQDAR